MSSLFALKSWLRGATALSSMIMVGCVGTQSPIPNEVGIRNPIVPPGNYAPNPRPATLPAPPELLAEKDKKTTESQLPTIDSNAVLTLDQVLTSVNTQFPLLLAIEQERNVAAGQRLATEGAFDTMVRASGINQEGSFGSNRLDFSVEQASPFSGMTYFAGYRLGLGDFPVYYGNRKTANGGELRAGFQIPLLRDGPIDMRRAALRQAQITEQLADPIIQRERITFLRNSTLAYWNWVAAGQRYLIQKELFELGQTRQKQIQKLLAEKQSNEIDLDENLRAVYNREEALISTERSFQQASFLLSLFLRDVDGNPITPTAGQLPKNFLDIEPPLIDGQSMDADVQIAYSQRPELQRFRLQKERLAVDLKLALNQFYPALNIGSTIAQDLGDSKSSFTGEGIFASDQTNLNLFLNMDIPWQRRGAQGRTRTIQAQLQQVLYQEKYTQDLIRNEVQDAISNLKLTWERLAVARVEQQIAQRIVKYESRKLDEGISDVIILNLREQNAANAKTKIADLLAAYYQAYADYLAAIGASSRTMPNQSQAAVPKEPAEPLPAPRPVEDKKD